MTLLTKDPTILGIISMYENIIQNYYVEESIKNLGYKMEIYDINNYDSEQIYNIIKNSNIQKWIFTGSSKNIDSLDSYKVPIKILDLTEKQFLLICYSMESFLHQLGYRLVKRDEDKKEMFNLFYNNKMLYLWRNHHYYIDSKSLDENVQFINSYLDETMTVIKNNVLMYQFHPERTDDGIELIKQWFKEI